MEKSGETGIIKEGELSGIVISILTVLKKENNELFELASKVSENYDYQRLLDVYNYIFKEIETKEVIKLIF